MPTFRPRKRMETPVNRHYKLVQDLVNFTARPRLNLIHHRRKEIQKCIMSTCALGQKSYTADPMHVTQDTTLWLAEDENSIALLLQLLHTYESNEIVHNTAMCIDSIARSNITKSSLKESRALPTLIRCYDRLLLNWDKLFLGTVNRSTAYHLLSAMKALTRECVPENDAKIYLDNIITPSVESAFAHSMIITISQGTLLERCLVACILVNVLGNSTPESELLAYQLCSMGILEHLVELIQDNTTYLPQLAAVAALKAFTTTDSALQFLKEKVIISPLLVQMLRNYCKEPLQSPNENPYLGALKQVEEIRSKNPVSTIATRLFQTREANINRSISWNVLVSLLQLVRHENFHQSFYDAGLLDLSFHIIERDYKGGDIRVLDYFGQLLMIMRNFFDEEMIFRYVNIILKILHEKRMQATTTGCSSITWIWELHAEYEDIVDILISNKAISIVVDMACTEVLPLIVRESCFRLLTVFCEDPIYLEQLTDERILHLCCQTLGPYPVETESLRLCAILVLKSLYIGRGSAIFDFVKENYKFLQKQLITYEPLCHEFLHQLRIKRRSRILEETIVPDSVSFTKEQIEEMKGLFLQFDGDLSCSVDVEELEQVFKHLEIKLTPIQLRAVMAAADSDGSGEIDFDEFVVVMDDFYQGRITGLGYITDIFRQQTEQALEETKAWWNKEKLDEEKLNTTELDHEASQKSKAALLNKFSKEAKKKQADSFTQPIDLKNQERLPDIKTLKKNNKMKVKQERVYDEPYKKHYSVKEAFIYL